MTKARLPKPRQRIFMDKRRTCGAFSVLLAADRDFQVVIICFKGFCLVRYSHVCKHASLTRLESITGFITCLSLSFCTRKDRYE